MPFSRVLATERVDLLRGMGRKKKIITLPSRKKETQVRISGPHEFCNDQFYLPYPLQDLSGHFEPGIYNMRLIYTQNVRLFSIFYFWLIRRTLAPAVPGNIVFHFLDLMACKFHNQLVPMCVFVGDAGGRLCRGCSHAHASNPPVCWRTQGE